jgi:hypothetical protein
MNKEQIRILLIDWMVNFLEKPNEKLSGWSPCPFSRKARLEDKIEIIFGDETDIRNNIFNSTKLLENRDVVIVCFDHTKINTNDFSSLVIDMNKELMINDIVLLEDHPEDEEYVNDLKLNFGHCALIFIQKLGKLQESSALLKNKNYYDVWSIEQYNKVVAWREILQNKSQTD